MTRSGSSQAGTRSPFRLPSPDGSRVGQPGDRALVEIDDADVRSRGGRVSRTAQAGWLALTTRDLPFGLHPPARRVYSRRVVGDDQTSRPRVGSVERAARGTSRQPGVARPATPLARERGASARRRDRRRACCSHRDAPAHAQDGVPGHRRIDCLVGHGESGDRHGTPAQYLGPQRSHSMLASSLASSRSSARSFCRARLRYLAYACASPT